jgi:hypothetical protein
MSSALTVPSSTSHQGNAQLASGLDIFLNILHSSAGAPAGPSKSNHDKPHSTATCGMPHAPSSTFPAGASSQHPHRSSAPDIRQLETVGLHSAPFAPDLPVLPMVNTRDPTDSNSVPGSQAALQTAGVDLSTLEGTPRSAAMHHIMSIPSGMGWELAHIGSGDSAALFDSPSKDDGAGVQGERYTQPALAQFSPPAAGFYKLSTGQSTTARSISEQDLTSPALHLTGVLACMLRPSAAASARGTGASSTATDSPVNKATLERGCV